MRNCGDIVMNLCRHNRDFVFIFVKNLCSFLQNRALARNKGFFSSPNDSTHMELYTFLPTLTVVLSGCVREKGKSQKRR